MPPNGDKEEEISTLEEARRKLYAPQGVEELKPPPLASAERVTPHQWKEKPRLGMPHLTRRHTRLATYFLAGSAAFFVLAASVAGYLLYYGGNAVSVKNIDLQIQGPTTIAGGDTVPLSLAITNRNSVAIEDATLEIDFPDGTRSADSVLSPLSIYSENIGTIQSGETVTKNIKAVIFGAADTTVTLPISLSYGAQGSNATFVKKATYPLAISSTPLSVSVATIAQTVTGKPFTITLQVRNNATVSLDNVLVAGSFPFGFSLISSSVTASGASFPLGTLAPGASKNITLVGSLAGESGEDRVFHFSVGTAKDTSSAELVVSYMTQDATVALMGPFIATNLTLNGASLEAATLVSAHVQDIVVNYQNMLSTNITDAAIAVSLSGSAVDYSSVRTTNGYYRSSDHTILFSKDTDPSLASLAPGAKGIGTFSFSTVPADRFGGSPSVTFTTSVTGTRVGESNVPESVTASVTQTVKAATAVRLAAASFHSSGPFANSGPIPPQVDTPTSYTISWTAVNGPSAVANATVSAVLPSYVTYTGAASGQGSLSYDEKSRTMLWAIGDLPQNASAKASFQVTLLPSASQKGSAPQLTGAASFAGYDRFAGVTVAASALPVTTETVGDPGYKASSGQVQ